MGKSSVQVKVMVVSWAVFFFDFSNHKVIYFYGHCYLIICGLYHFLSGNIITVLGKDFGY